MNTALLAKRVASRYKLAGLLDRGLVDRAVKAILSDRVSHATTPYISALELDVNQNTSVKTQKQEVLIGDGDWETYEDFAVPKIEEIKYEFIVPAALLAQVSPDLHGEFLMEVLHKLARVTPESFLNAAFDGFEEYISELNSRRGPLGGTYSPYVSFRRVTAEGVKVVSVKPLSSPVKRGSLISMKIVVVVSVNSFDLDENEFDSESYQYDNVEPPDDY